MDIFLGHKTQMFFLLTSPQSSPILTPGHRETLTQNLTITVPYML